LTSDEIRVLQPTHILFKQAEEWPNSKKLLLEKQVVGFFISGHPMETWQKICDEWLGWNTEKVKDYLEKKRADGVAHPEKQQTKQGSGFVPGQGYMRRDPQVEVKIAGLIGETKEIKTKKGQLMCFAELEDLLGKVEIVLFPEAYESFKELFAQATATAETLLVTGDMKLTEETPKILVRNVEWLAQANKSRVQHVVLRLEPARTTPEQLRELKRQLLASPGKCPIRIEFLDPSYRTSLQIPKNLSVMPTPKLVQTINQIFGQNVVSLM
jgi:DNA polymerase III alpha subunit